MIGCDFCFSGPEVVPGAHFGAHGAAFGLPNEIVFSLRPIYLRGAGSHGLRRLALDALGVHHAMSHELLRDVVDAPGGTNRHY